MVGRFGQHVLNRTTVNLASLGVADPLTLILAILLFLPFVPDTSTEIGFFFLHILILLYFYYFETDDAVMGSAVMSHKFYSESQGSKCRVLLSLL